MTNEMTVLPPAGTELSSAACSLEQQLASCSALVANLSDFVIKADRDTSLDACHSFMVRMCDIMRASAETAKVVGRLRSNEPEETRHRMIVEYEGRGEGVRQP